MSKSTLTQMDPFSQEFADWLVTPGFRRPTATVMHHTASPTAAQYKGRSTIVAIRSYHMSKGWSDIAAQGYACPDGTVFTARPLDADNYCHAYILRKKPLENLAQYWQGNRQYLNCAAPAFGLETVANFSSENPWVPGSLAARSLECAMRVLTVVHREFNIPAVKCFFHYQAEDKDCPGDLLNLREFREELARRLGGIKPSVPVVVGPDNKVIDCKPQMVGEEMTVAAVPLLDALGVPLTALRLGVVHANGRAYVGEMGRDLKTVGWSLVFKQMAQGPRVYCKRAVQP